MLEFKRITIFCGSSSGLDEIYMEKASYLGNTLASRNIQVVYGGANVGLMGAIANAAMEAGGKVLGVIPEFLKAKEIAHNNITKLLTVESMHQRKKLMHEISDAVIALPGGFGTMEEFFEMLTWAQLGLHRKPIGIYNINGFYNPLIQQIDLMVKHGFLKEDYRKMILVNENLEELLDTMQVFEAPDINKWVEDDYNL